MDDFDKRLREDVQGYLKKYIHFSREENQQIRSKTINKSSTNKFHGVYYTVLASTIVLFAFLSIPFFDVINFNSNSQFDSGTVTENETEEKIRMDWEGSNRSQNILSNDAKNKIQLSIINNPEKYKLRKASLNYREKSGAPKDTVLALSFQSQKNAFFTQIFKGEINLEDNHNVVEKVGEWRIIPKGKTPSHMEENNYTIAISEIITNHEKYTIVVQTYDLHNDIDAAPYSKTDIVDFIESLNPEVAVKNLLEHTSEG